MQTILLNIEGMTCQGCAKNVQQALAALAGVQSVVVDLAQKIATVEVADSAVGKDQLAQAVEEAGFDVV